MSTKKSKIGTKPKLQAKKKFSLKDFKKKNKLDNTSFKPQTWLKISDDFKDVVGVGIPRGVVSLLMGHSDSGKTSAMLLAVADSQKKGNLPVLIITEMKWSWEHAREMGVQFEEIEEEVLNEETGELETVKNYEGQFIYIDKSQLESIEDVAEFINELINLQDKDELPFDLDIFWDSIGSVPCRMSIKNNKNNNEWNAGAFSREFGGGVNQRITSSRKSNSKYTNSLICINKVWVDKPDHPMGAPKLMTKGGTTMYYDAAMVIQFGNVKNAGTTKIKATKDGKSTIYASRVNVSIKKNHINGVSTSGKIVVTPTDIIEDNKSKIDKYKKDHINYIAKMLGDVDLDKLNADDFVDEEESDDIDVTKVEPNNDKSEGKESDDDKQKEKDINK